VKQRQVEGIGKLLEPELLPVRTAAESFEIAAIVLARA
jgi:hypothetical protein